MALESLSSLALAAYIVVLSLVCIYGAHRYFLVGLYYRFRKAGRSCASRFTDLPWVTVQLRCSTSATSPADHRAGLPYRLPCRRLEIQVLDDSTDDTQTIARKTVERMRPPGTTSSTFTVTTARLQGRRPRGRPENRPRRVRSPSSTRTFCRQSDTPGHDSLLSLTRRSAWSNRGHLNRDVSVLTQAQAYSSTGTS